MTPFTHPPKLDDLTARFLARKSADGADDAIDEGDVEPHEVVAGFRVEARVCWTEATAALRLLAETDDKPLPPPEWAAYAAVLASAYAVPLAVGFFPQRVREFHPLLGTADLTRFQPTATAAPAAGFVSLRGWVRKVARGSFAADAVLASGLAVNVGDGADAATTLATAKQRGSDAMRAVLANQEAAVLWATGRCAEALAAWEARPVSAVTLFNRGMALLFLGRAADAIPLLADAVAKLPPDTGWSHLAKLYGSLARTRA
jgi:hypothetical protein